ncbi:hypothetical protein AAW12_18940 [Sphingobacterium sp. Ag1]|uniref:hypothetical protein n=1 Tax=Sphingobacterium sp. Ag1 TaxID=1643451 RepID=UPI0006275A96|nr:hypothetical protein [Sphingobacterium sp. Ag1]KKO89683.1 hypothetical protein AAW12_18940 [Sphingobacterium sp. Ag1]
MANQFLIKNTMADMRNLSACEIVALESGCFPGIELLGYYEKGDTPCPIKYFLSNTVNTDDGGSIVQVQAIKLEHRFVGSVHPAYYGIVDSATIRQDDRLEKFSNYLDRTNIYEIDFCNYSIVAPKTLLFTTARQNPVRGLGFKNAHKIKNLFIINDKSTTLHQGDNCIVFHPNDNKKATFALENVVFDAYVADFQINNGEYDGLMLGFLCYADPSWSGFSNRTLTDYRVEVNNINFISPAISYNLSFAGLFMQENKITNIAGEYWGLYVHVFAKNIYVKKATGLFRKDLQANSGRVLVTSLIHQEPEIAVMGNANPPALALDSILLSEIKCVDNLGAASIGFKHHSLAPLTINEVKVDHFNANFQVYTPSLVPGHTTIDRIYIDSSNYSPVVPLFYITVNVNSLECVNSNISFCGEYPIVNNRNPQMESVSFRNSVVRNLSFPTQEGGVINHFILDNCTIVKGQDDRDNIVRNAGVTLKNIDVRNTIVNTKQLFYCSFEKVTLDQVVFSDPYFSDTISLSSSTAANVSIDGIRINADLVAQYNYFIIGTVGSNLSYSIVNSYTGRRLRISNATKLYEAGVSPIESNTTANRPAGLDARSTGLRFIDTTLNKVITWSGTAWLEG